MMVARGITLARVGAASGQKVPSGEGDPPVFEWQRAYPLAGEGEYGVRDGRRDQRHADLPEPARLVALGNDLDLDRRAVPHARGLGVVEGALPHPPVLEGGLAAPRPAGPGPRA